MCLNVHSEYFTVLPRPTILFIIIFIQVINGINSTNLHSKYKFSFLFHYIFLYYNSEYPPLYYLYFQNSIYSSRSLNKDFHEIFTY